MIISKQVIDDTLSALDAVASNACCTSPQALRPTISSSSPSSSISEQQWREYQQRLASFTSSGWFGKPDFASASVCARHGWQLAPCKRERLTCNVCHRSLSYCFPLVLFDAQVYDKCRADFTHALKAEHLDLCPWASTTCPESFATSIITTSPSGDGRTRPGASPASPASGTSLASSGDMQGTAQLLRAAFVVRLGTFLKDVSQNTSNNVDDAGARTTLQISVASLPVLASSFAEKLVCFLVRSVKELTDIVAHCDSLGTLGNSIKYCRTNKFSTASTNCILAVLHIAQRRSNSRYA
jgi:hypothetical protein